jgi:hypothetical protein
MNKPLAVSDPDAHHEEYIERWAKSLGRSKLRTQIFKFIYGRGSRPKTVTEIMQKLRIPSGDRQLVLNEINRLWRKRLITKDQTSSSGGRTEFVFGKIDGIMDNKAKVLKFPIRVVDRNKIPTKRRPQIGITRITRQSSNSRGAKLKVLYLTAAPGAQGPIRTDAEFRKVQHAIRGSKFRDKIELIASPAADAKSILDGINDYRPQIVHFSGHGGRKSIWLDDGKVKNSIGQSMEFGLLAGVLGATSSPPTLLVLNACETTVGAEILLSAVKAVVAMSDSISDEAAATFAEQFYAAIASAQPVSIALAQGKIAMKTAKLKDANLPHIIVRKDVDSKKLTLIKRR